jgi:hypothetical protein
MSERALTIITESEWDTQYEPINQSPIDTDAPLIKATDPHHVWTQCESGSDDPDTVYTGIRRVNRVGFWITLKPWQDDRQVAVTFGEVHSEED